MVSPARLVEVVSVVTGVALPTVVDMDRRLVSAGLRTKGGRGRSAARMTAGDATHLLTAILASPQSNVAAEAVQRYAATAVDTTRSSAALFGAIRLDDLATLTPAHDFTAALAALLTSAAEGDLAVVCRTLPTDAWPRIEVYAFTRAVYGRIRLSGLPNGMTASVEYRPLTGADPYAATGDLEQSRRITERTIYGIAAVLRGEDRHG